MNIKSENLLNEIEKRKDDLIDLTQKLIRIPTLNPPGNNYLEICEFLKQRMEKKLRRLLSLVGWLVGRILRHIDSF